MLAYNNNSRDARLIEELNACANTFNPKSPSYIAEPVGNCV